MSRSHVVFCAAFVVGNVLLYVVAERFVGQVGASMIMPWLGAVLGGVMIVGSRIVTGRWPKDGEGPL